MADSAGQSRICANDRRSNEEKNGHGQENIIERQRSLSAASVSARAKLTLLIQLASEAEAEGKAGYKKVADTVFDSVS